MRQVFYIFFISILAFSSSVSAEEVSSQMILEKMGHIAETQNLILEQMDKRFEQVDKRFEQVDKRFEQVDKRFEFIQYLLGGLLVAVIGMPLISARRDHKKEEEFDQMRRLVIAMKEMAIHDEKLSKVFKAAGLL